MQCWNNFSTMSYLFALLISRSNYEFFALSTRVFFFIWCSINHYPLVNILLFLFLISHHLSALKGIDNRKEKFLLGRQKEQKGFGTNLVLKKIFVSLLPPLLGISNDVPRGWVGYFQKQKLMAKTHGKN